MCIPLESPASTPPPNQLMANLKQTRREAEEDKEGEGNPPPKRSVTPANHVAQEPIGFNMVWSLEGTPSE